MRSFLPFLLLIFPSIMAYELKIEGADLSCLDAPSHDKIDEVLSKIVWDGKKVLQKKGRKARNLQKKLRERKLDCYTGQQRAICDDCNPGYDSQTMLYMCRQYRCCGGYGYGRRGLEEKSFDTFVKDVAKAAKAISKLDIPCDTSSIVLTPVE